MIDNCRDPYPDPHHLDGMKMLNVFFSVFFCGGGGGGGGGRGGNIVFI